MNEWLLTIRLEMDTLETTFKIVTLALACIWGIICLEHQVLCNSGQGRKIGTLLEPRRSVSDKEHLEM